jgi:DNA-binding MarR family transcriptional regulator
MMVCVPRPDLAASFHRITRTLIEREQPILARHDVSMWEYVALSALREERGPIQNELAAAIGYDRSRLVSLVDRLEMRGLAQRERSAPDRRARRILITNAGLALHRGVQRDIRRMESRFLSRLPSDERAVLLAALARLSRQRAADA